MTAPVDHRRCCRRAEHADYTTGQQQDAHQCRNALTDLAREWAWPAVIVGTACLPLAILWWVAR